MKLTKACKLFLAATLLGSAKAVAVAPGAATQQAADKLTTLGVKYETQLEELELKFEEQSKEFETKICEGIGCEPDDKKRAEARIKWDGIVRAYKSGKAHLVNMLTMCWKAKDSVPLRRHFAEWLSEEKLQADAATVWNVQRNLRCEDYAMSYEEMGGGTCGEGKAGGGGLIVPLPPQQPAGCIPMPSKDPDDESDEDAAKEAPFKFHCGRQCECMAMCDLGKGCTHVAWNSEELSDTTKDNCILYGGGDCTPDGSAGFKVFEPAA